MGREREKGGEKKGRESAIYREKRRKPEMRERERERGRGREHKKGKENLKKVR